MLCECRPGQRCGAEFTHIRRAFQVELGILDLEASLQVADKARPHYGEPNTRPELQHAQTLTPRPVIIKTGLVVQHVGGTATAKISLSMCEP